MIIKTGTVGAPLVGAQPAAFGWAPTRGARTIADPCCQISLEGSAQIITQQAIDSLGIERRQLGYSVAQHPVDRLVDGRQARDSGGRAAGVRAARQYKERALEVVAEAPVFVVGLVELLAPQRQLFL